MTWTDGYPTASYQLCNCLIFLYPGLTFVQLCICFWGQSVEAFLSYQFRCSNYRREKSLFPAFILAALSQWSQTQSTPKLVSLTGSTAGKSAEPWTSYLRHNLQISGPGLQRLNSRRPQRKKPINLSQFNGSSDVGSVATIQGHTGTSGFCPEAWCLKFFAFVSEIISQVHIFISFFYWKH